MLTITEELLYAPLMNPSSLQVDFAQLLLLQKIEGAKCHSDKYKTPSW